MIILRMIAFRPQGLLMKTIKRVSLESDFDDEESTVKGADSSVIEVMQPAQHSNKKLSQNKSDIPDLDSLDWNKIFVIWTLRISYNIASHCALANSIISSVTYTR